jgi:DNA adenine methylase
MTIRSLAPWFGGKRTLAPRIVAELGKHTQYFEPFCGSMAVLFAKEPSQKETVNDLHGDVTNLARVVSIEDFAVALYRKLDLVVMSEGILEDAAGVLATPFEDDRANVDRAFWFFLQSWLMRNGVAGTNIGEARGIGTNLAVRFTNGGGSPTVRFQNAVRSIPAWHARLKNVVVMRRDAFRLVEKFEDAKGTAIYADPPYPAETRSGFNGSGAQSRYRHEFTHDADGGMFGGDDHSRLAEVLRGFKKSRVVVSTYDCPRYRELYEGWTFVPCPMAKLLHAQNGRGNRRKEAPEVLIVNGPSLSAGGEW